MLLHQITNTNTCKFNETKIGKFTAVSEFSFSDALQGVASHHRDDTCATCFASMYNRG